MLPLFLALAGKLGVVVGGGAVGRRKTRALLEAGARVRLICLEARPVEETRADLEWVRAHYRGDHLDGAALVFAAAGAEVNRRVVADARARGAWVNSATEPQAGDFFLPAVLRRGRLTVAVGTEGAAPALAGAVRRILEGELDESFAHWAELLAELRPAVFAAVAEPALRQEVLEALCRPEWLERLRRDGPRATGAAMRQEVGRLVGGAGDAV